MSSSHPLYHTFKPWEPHLQQIISRYPSPTTVHCSGRSPSTVRQNLQQALRLLVSNPQFSSVIPPDQAQLAYRTFVFSPNPDGSVYVGPRRSRLPRGSISLADGNSPPPAIPPINCSNPVTANAIFHLKNFDLIPFPITITDFTQPFDFSEHYPNIELIPNPDGSHTIL